MDAHRKSLRFQVPRPLPREFHPSRFAGCGVAIRVPVAEPEGACCRIVANKAQAGAVSRKGLLPAQPLLESPSAISFFLDVPTAMMPLAQQGVAMKGSPIFTDTAVLRVRSIRRG
jgi:hypothetical protein